VVFRERRDGLQECLIPVLGLICVAAVCVGLLLPRPSLAHKVPAAAPAREVEAIWDVR